jgi:hypothetical protein
MNSNRIAFARLVLAPSVCCRTRETEIQGVVPLPACVSSEDSGGKQRGQGQLYKSGKFLFQAPKINIILIISCQAVPLYTTQKEHITL